MQSNPFPSAASLDGYQRISGSCSVKEQIQLYTGNLMCQYSVVNVPTIGMPLLFDLIYNAQDAVSGPVGKNWRHNFMMHLELDSATSPSQVVFVSDSGSRFNWSWSGSAWVPVASSHFLPATLSTSGAHYLLTMPSGDVLTFELDNGTFSISGTLTSASSTVSTVSDADLNRLHVGDVVQHADLPSGTTVISIGTGSFDVSASATGSASGAAITATVADTMYRLKNSIDNHGFTVAMTYNSAGQLTTVTDPTGNRTIALGYDATTGLLNSIMDPNGQAATPAYATTLAYDSSLNLTTVTGPELCVTTYGYSTPANHLLTSRTDSLSHEVQFGYTQNTDSSSALYQLYQLTSVQDPDGHLLAYGYDRVTEDTGFAAASNLNRTRLVDPRVVKTVSGSATAGNNGLHVTGSDLSGIAVGNAIGTSLFPSGSTVIGLDTAGNNLTMSENALATGSSSTITINAGTWEYRFDADGNLWRLIDPMSNYFHFRWDADQQMTYACGPFKWSSVPQADYRDNLNNSFSFRAYDLSDPKSGGNLIYDTDASGRVDHYVYDSRNHLTDVFPAQGNFGIQGLWTDHFGKDGYLLCAFDNTTGDRAQLPAYINPSISMTGVRVHDVDTADGAVFWKHLLDPRLPVAADSLTRNVGFWKQSSGTSSFSFNLALASGYSDQKFNVSLYTHSADLTYAVSGGNEVVTPLTYAEQFGRDVTIAIVDAAGSQSFRVYNNAPGAWVTFAVHATTAQPVQVTVSASGPYPSDAVISAICFDPYESRRISYGYDTTTGDLTSVAQSPSATVTNTTTLSYDPTSKLLSSVTDPRTHSTAFNYDATYKDLTSLVDRNSKTWRMSYDRNANLLTYQDPVLYGINPSLQTVTYTYDKKNRVKTVSDALNNTVTYDYDSAGNITQIVDANSNATSFVYTPMNRLQKITDALSQQTVFAYDEAGYLTSITDPKSNVTSFVMDTAGRMTSVILPDVESGTSTHTQLQMAYDGLSRLVAVTTPNGTQSNDANVNVVNAFNVLRNPSAEVADPTDATKALFWSGVSGGSSPASRDGSTPSPGPITGNYTFQSSGAGGWYRWTQSNPPMLAGTKAFQSAWTMVSTSGNARVFSDIWIKTGVDGGGLDGGAYPVYSNTIDFNGTRPLEWEKLQMRFDVPGDAQFSDSPVPASGASFDNIGANIWYDDFALYSLSAAVAYDRAGRPMLSQTPDGATSMNGYDRAGRLTRMIDSKGRVWQLGYDGADRITSMTDPRLQTSTISYDQNNNVSSVTDANANITSYAYDNEDRLTTITYPDGTFESFSFDDDGRVHTYTDNLGQQRTMAYDNARRLTSVTYNVPPPTPSTAVSFTYDDMGNVLTMTERNGDVTTYTRDVLYRVTREARTLGSGSPTLAWTHGNRYDANDNRTEVEYVPGSIYGPATGAGVYGGTGISNPATYADIEWRALGYASGYDSMDRLTAYQDHRSNQTSFTYDVESRVTGVHYPNGVVTTPTYDVMGRVIDLDSVNGAGGNVLSISNGYDIASNRNSLVVDNDTFDYGFDEDGQMLEESVNRFIERRYEHFQQGALNGLQLNADGTLTLLAFNDNFSGPSMSSDRWQLFASSLAVANVDVRQQPGLQQSFVQNSGLAMGYPVGYSDVIEATPRASSSSFNPYGLITSQFWVNIQHRMQLSGNFEIQTDFLDFQAAASGEVLTGLLVSDAPFPQNPGNYAFIARGVDAANTQQYIARTSITGTTTNGTSNVSGVSGGDLAKLFVGATVAGPYLPAGTTVTAIHSGTGDFDISNNANNSGTISIAVSAIVNASDITGKLRLARSSNNITLSYWDGSTWQALHTYAFASLASSLYVSIHYTNTSGLGSVRWQNFTQNDTTTHSSITRYATSGTYTSRLYDTGAISGRTVHWLNLLPTSTTPSGTSLSFQLSTNVVAEPHVRVAGTITNGSSIVTGVSTSDLALLSVGMPIYHYAFTSGTTISSIGSGQFTASSNASLSTSPLTNAQIGFVLSPTTTALASLPATGRYASYQATFSGSGTATPVLNEVDLVYDGTTPSRKSIHVYDGAGNLTERVTTLTTSVTGTVTNGSASITGVSSGDMAKVFVGATICNYLTMTIQVRPFISERPCPEERLMQRMVHGVFEFEAPTDVHGGGARCRSLVD